MTTGETIAMGIGILSCAVMIFTIIMASIQMATNPKKPKLPDLQVGDILQKKEEPRFKSDEGKRRQIMIDEFSYDGEWVKYHTVNTQYPYHDFDKIDRLINLYGYIVVKKANE